MMTKWYAVRCPKFLKCLVTRLSPQKTAKRLSNIVDDSFDVVILDINMPDMGGFETISALNKLGFDIPVLFLTGAGSMDYAVKAINLGAYDFLNQTH